MSYPDRGGLATILCAFSCHASHNQDESCADRGVCARQATPCYMIDVCFTSVRRVAQRELWRTRRGLKVLEERLVPGVNLDAVVLVGVRVLIEVGGVVLGLYLGHDGRGDLAPQESVEVQAHEPLVLLNIIRPALEVANALGEVGGEELLDQVLGVAVKVPRELDLALEDLLVDTERILVVKRRVPSQHLVDEDAHSPPVHSLAVAFAENDLGREVLWCAAECPSPILDTLGKAKVGDFDVARVIKQQVLRLEVPVDDGLSVQVLEGKDDLRGIEARCFVGEAPRLAQVGEELATDDVLHHQVEVHGVLEGSKQVDDEGVIDHLEDLLLHLDVVHLLEVDYL
mmetsp:Transcript_70/g.283  ORF Transcript_70/g.283 Transcript_70/m.283 type:complete len:342 (+) Transcript_70:594-1619(+)